MGLFSNTTSKPPSSSSGSSGRNRALPCSYKLIGREEAKRIMTQAMDYRSRQKLKPFILNSLSSGKKSVFSLSKSIYHSKDLGRIPRNKFNAAVKKYYEKISGGSAQEIKKMEDKIKEEREVKIERHLRANLAGRVAKEREIEGPLTKEKIAKSIYNRQGVGTGQCPVPTAGSDLTRKMEEEQGGIAKRNMPPAPPIPPKSPGTDALPLRKI